MKTLYINPQSGIAGDMLVGALLDAGADTPEFWEQLRSLPLPADEWDAEAKPVVKRGIKATKFDVSFTKHDHDHGHNHHHHGRHLSTVLKIIAESGLSKDAKQGASQAFELLADAEAFVHGTTREKVHFHEVGAVDAIVDICGACLALNILGIDEVVCSPPALGGGTVNCDHGLMAVPVPAVTKLLEGKPSRLGPVDCELTTPTGAALLCTLTDDFSGRCSGVMRAVGYGSGAKDFETHANVVQVCIYETSALMGESVTVVECNLDDMTGEELAFVGEQLLANGALDYTLIPCTMKKGRPGVILQVLCPDAKREAVGNLILRQTSSFGVRYSDWQRQILEREIMDVETELGSVQVKVGRDAITGDIVQLSPEYSSCEQVAIATGVPIRSVYATVKSAAREKIDR